MSHVTQSVEIVYWGAQWLGPFAILASASIGAYVATQSIARAREIARLRATLDVILKTESDTHFQSIYSTFTSERSRNGGLVALTDAKSDQEHAAKRKVDDFLNHYELIAISIEKGILDEGFYTSWMKTSFIKHYNQSKEYIAAVRKTNAKAYTEFEALALKWDSE